MNPLLAGFACASLFVSMASGDKPGALSNKDILEIKMKILDLRDKISTLSKQEEALLKQLEQANKVAVKADEPYVKVEVKGILKEYMPGLWEIHPGGFRSWTLEFGNKRDLPEFAKQLKGRTVVITGHLDLQHTGRTFGKEEILIIKSLKAAGQ